MNGPWRRPDCIVSPTIHDNKPFRPGQVIPDTPDSSFLINTVVLETMSQAGQGLVRPPLAGDDGLGLQFQQGHENKGPQVHPGMRQDQFRGPHALIPIQKQIQVDAAGGEAQSGRRLPCPALLRPGGRAHPAQGSLHGQQSGHEFPRGQAGIAIQGQDLVGEPGLVLESLRLGPPDPGTAGRGHAIEGLHGQGGPVQVGRRVVPRGRQVGSQPDKGPYGPGRYRVSIRDTASSSRSPGTVREMRK